MGRRKRSRSSDEGDDLEAFERSWLDQRKKSVKQHQVDEHHVKEKESATPVDAKLQKEAGRDGASINNKVTNSTPAPSSTSEQEKIEKQRLKKQRQKERRREKKAQSLASKESATKQKLQLEQVASKQKQLQLDKQQSKAKNASQSYRTLSKCVQVLALSTGKGPSVQHRKKIRVSYTLRAKSHTGKIIDASKNFPFRLGKGEVISGWDIGLEGMKVGGVRRLIVPSGAGYGNKDVGAGRGADLYFEVELLYVAP
ncbi:hypothetical protein ACHAXN_006855 [Cyclotella atomus]